MTGFERRWRDALLDAMLPGFPRGDAAGFWALYRGAAPPLLRFGFRASVWALTWLPLFVLGRPRTFAALPADDRQRFLRRVAGSRFAVLRQMLATVKVLACFAALRDPTTRRRLETTA